MPLLATAKNHFDDDIRRARALRTTAIALAQAETAAIPLPAPNPAALPPAVATAVGGVGTGGAPAVQAEPVSKDVLRASWMMAVGALDAYFSDAYADVISRTLR